MWSQEIANVERGKYECPASKRVMGNKPCTFVTHAGYPHTGYPDHTPPDSTHTGYPDPHTHTQTICKNRRQLERHQTHTHAGPVTQ